GELVSGDTYSGALSRVAGENAGLYQILQGSLVLPNNYNVTYVSSDFEILKATSVITWENPADIIVGTALSAAQLNATADVDGTFDYNPESGTVLAVGNDQALYVLFTPTDITNYNTAEKTVYINVLLDSKICDQNIISANIYPNPTNGLLIINNEGIGISEVSLINTTGQVIFVEKMNTDKINLDLSDLPAGAYLLILNTDNGIINEKIIKR
ncbi:MAG TPA: T9SS type A sorting domain-containing protein, partial [Bacteroidales bacterium]|nr:T9SS type A sorting domain-containing protein [Bacteroidales bacterium]